MLGLTRRSRRERHMDVTGPFGLACPKRRCGTYWSTADDTFTHCPGGGHTVRTCGACGHSEAHPEIPCDGCRRRR